MQTAVINIRLNPQTKKKAQAVAQGLGMSLSVLINGYLKNLIKTKTVHFDLEEQPSDYLIQCIKEAEEDIKNNRLLSFKKPKDALAYLNKIIENEQKSKKD
jgi:addiction module RelB/DinJ family antitoxin